MSYKISKFSDVSRWNKGKFYHTIYIGRKSTLHPFGWFCFPSLASCICDEIEQPINCVALEC